MSEGEHDFEFAVGEDPARPSPWRYGWLLGVIVLGLAGWQTSTQVAAKSALHDRTATAPAHVQSADRGERERRPSMKRDPLTRYLERAERGMSDQEIRQVLNDYQKQFPAQQQDLMFTHVPIGPKAFISTSRREAQEQWYLQALTEALGLTKAQQEQAIIKMWALLQSDRAAIERGGCIAVHDPRTGLRVPDDAEIVSASSYPAAWMNKDAYAPWNLCDLTAAQAALTSRDLLIEMRQQQTEAGWKEIAWYSLHAPDQLTLSEGKYVVSEFAEDPFVERFLKSNVLPITEAQAASGGRKYLEQARLAQPAQLRMELLLQPEAVEILLAQLDGKSHSPATDGAMKAGSWHPFPEPQAEAPQQNGEPMEPKTDKVEE